MLSHKCRSYLYPYRVLTTSATLTSYCLLHSGMIVEVFSVRDLPADLPLLQDLGFNHISSYMSFLLSHVPFKAVRFSVLVYRL